MNDHKNQSQQNENASEQNPTLNSPGSKVADYGNTTGGSAVENDKEQQSSNPQRGTADREGNGGNETIGNP